MTRTDALQVECPYCGVAAGEPCVGARLQERTAMHAERHMATRRRETKRRRRRFKARKVTVRHADGSTETVKPGHFRNRPRKPKGWYANYLQSPHWKRLRRATLERDGRRCRVCRRATGLHVHHLTYERLGHELLQDLVTLCGDCHTAHHRGVNLISREVNTPDRS